MHDIAASGGTQARYGIHPEALTAHSKQPLPTFQSMCGTRSRLPFLRIDRQAGAERVARCTGQVLNRQLHTGVYKRHCQATPTGAVNAWRKNALLSPAVGTVQHRFVKVPEEQQRVGADVSMVVALGTILLPLHHLQTVAREDGQHSATGRACISLHPFINSLPWPCLCTTLGQCLLMRPELRQSIDSWLMCIPATWSAGCS